jgi:hypothetical protein
MIQTHRDDRRQAYQMGYDDSIELTTDQISDLLGEEPDGTPPEWVGEDYWRGFASGSQWADSVLPRLAAIAGYEGAADSWPVVSGDAERRERLDETLRAYRDGWVDKSLGYDRYSSRPHLAETADGQAVDQEGGQ